MNKSKNRSFFTKLKNVERKYHLDIFWCILKKFKKYYFIAMVIALLKSVTGYAAPLINILIIDHGIGKKNINLLLLAVMLMIALYVICEVIAYIDTKFNMFFRYKIELFVKKKVISYCIYNSFSENSSGEYETLITSDSERVVSLSLSLFSSIALSLFNTITSLVVLLKIQPLLSIPAVIMQVVMVLIRLKTSNIEEKNGSMARESFVKLWSVITELVNNIRNIAILGAGRYAEKRFENAMKNDYNVRSRNNLFSTKICSFVSVGMSASTCILLALGGILVILEKMTVGKLVTFNQYAGNLSTPLLELFTIPTDMSAELASLDRVAHIFNYKYDKDINQLKHVSSIKVDKLSFSYGEKKILENVVAEFEKGTKYYIRGKSGSGKSTFINLISGRQSYESGEIFYDGISLKDIDVESRMELISFVSQDAVLFNDSIENNIILDLEYNKEKLEKVCKCCRIYDDIINLPDSFSTMVSENGINFSGGQKSRLCLARALYQEKPIIIIDEVTAGLDSDTESELRDNLVNELSDKITLIITHSNNFVMLNSVIYYLNKNHLNVKENT
ncbi:MAG: ABC transporter ATP-binding protein [Ruminococcus sp.]|nr:ABC transporter ATP-binding protein [Ruminococcus sp.]